MLKRIKIDPLVLAILGSVFLAYLFPQFGSQDSPIPMDQVSRWGISLIFFFYGVSLDIATIKNGLKNWKLHLVVQGSTFLLFPSLVLIFYPLAHHTSYELTWLSFLFLAALPSTVSSSVVMVSIAKGNLPAAIFNASISGILGILLTPLWMTPFINPDQVDYDFTAIYTQLITEIVVPLTIGLLLHRYIGKLAKTYNRELSLFDKFIILVIVYKSFARSFAEGIFTSVSWLDLVILVGLVLVLFFLVYNLTGWIGKLLHFSHPDRITNQFCGTKKSLIHGTVFSQALFGGSGIVGIILLPVMLYHALQILIISIFASKIGKERGPGLARSAEE